MTYGLPSINEPHWGQKVLDSIEAVKESADAAVSQSQVDDVVSDLNSSIDDVRNTAAEALALKADRNSPVLTGTPTAPTAAVATNNNQVATTKYVKDQGYATVVSPTLTGNPTAPTPAATDNDTSIATTKFVKDQGYVPSTLTATETKLLTSPTDNTTGGLTIQDNPANPRVDPGESLLLVRDYLDAPIFSVPVAGGPKVFGDSLGVWTSVWERAASFTPWGSVQVGNGAAQKQIWFCKNAPLDAETIGQITTMAVPGFDPYPKVGDLCISTLDERTMWRCTVAGTSGDKDGQWLPITVGSSIKAVVNASTTSAIPASAEFVFAFNAITLTLPNPASVVHGRYYTIKNGGASNVTVAAHAGAIIDGAATVVLTPNQSVNLVGLTSLWARA